MWFPKVLFLKETLADMFMFHKYKRFIIFFYTQYSNLLQSQQQKSHIKVILQKSKYETMVKSLTKVWFLFSLTVLTLHHNWTYSIAVVQNIKHIKDYILKKQYTFVLSAISICFFNYLIKIWLFKQLYFFKQHLLKKTYHNDPLWHHLIAAAERRKKMLVSN